MQKLLAIFLLFLAAQVTAQQRLTIADAIARTLEHNFDVRVADIALQQANANNTLGNAGLLPSINGTAELNAGSTNTRIEFADGRQQTVTNAGTFSYNAGISAGYTVFAAGRGWLIRRQLGLNEEFNEALLRDQVQRSVSQTIQTYARAVWQQQQGVAIDSALALAQTRMVLSRLKFETGASAKVDYLQARVDYNSRQSDSLQQLALLNAAFADLNTLMGEDPFTTYLLDDSLALNISLSPVQPNLLRESNLSILAARKNAEITKLDERIARTALFPSLGLNAGYNYSRSQSQAGVALFNQGFGPTGGATLNVPIFQGGNIRRQVKVASLETLRQEILVERQNTEIGRQYRTAWKDYESSISAYRLEQENIGYARENLDIQKARFRVGIATTLETREAEISYVQALIRLYTAAYNLKLNETRVLELESSLVK